MKFFKILFFLLFPFFSLHADETIPALISCIEGVPEATIADHVDAVSGQYVDVEVDLYLLGPDPLVLQRNYESGDFALGENRGNWRLLSHCFLIAGEDKNGKGCTIRGERYIQEHTYAGERLGSFFCYRGWRNTQIPIPYTLKLLTKNYILGLTNCVRGEICARTFPKTNQMIYRQEKDRYEILSGDGTLRIYSLSNSPSHPLFAAQLLQNFASCLQKPKFYHLEEEKLPSGNHILYSYDENGNPLSISVYGSKDMTPFSQITFKYSKDTCKAFSDDGRQVVYHFDNEKLVKVERAEQPDICYTYDPNHHRLVRRVLPNGSFLQIAYDKENRVSSIIDPDGEQALFFYMPNATKVRYPSAITKHHHFDSQRRLTAIDTYTPQGMLYTRECWHWEKENNKNGLLLFKTFEDAHQNILKCKSYTYDERGNPLEELLYGNLTGKPQAPIRYKPDGTPDLTDKECHRKTYTYSSDSYNLVTKQGDSKGNEIIFTYKPNTNLLTAKYILEKGKVRKRYFYSYNTAGALTEEIEDDGSEPCTDRIWGWEVSRRHITRITPNEKGLPVVVEKTYRSLFIKDHLYSTANADLEFLISKTVNTYDPHGHLIKQEIFDTENTFQYSIERTYNKKGNLLTETDPANQTIVYTHDLCNQKITEHAPHQNKVIYYTYDLKGRCIEVQEVLDNLSFTTQTHFDKAGNKITTTDRFGNQINYQYDPFGRPIEAIYPLVLDETQKPVQPIFLYTYDLFGNCIELTDPKGFVTKTKFNIRGQPTHIDYPDGSYELCKYDVEGSLHRQSTRDQTIYVFEYDYLGRLTTQERSTYNPDGYGSWTSITSNKYNAFHKIGSKNEEACAILYQYDGGGRLISEIRPEAKGSSQEDDGAQKKEFVYNTLGRLSAIKTWYGKNPDDFSLVIRKYNLLGQITEERGEDPIGNEYWKKRFKYDSYGNLAQKTAYLNDKPFIEANTLFDPLTNPISYTDGLGKTYHIQNDYAHHNSLGQKILKKTLFDPSGVSTEMIYDAMGRLNHVKQLDHGKDLLTRDILYDLNGNKCVETTSNLGQQFRIEWDYGPMNRIENITKAAGTAEATTTFFTYTERGQLASRLDPSSKSAIIYIYNHDGTLQKISHQSEKEVDLSNRYFYDRNGNITRSYALGGIDVSRRYNAFDQIIEEEFKDEIGTYHLGYSYDRTGRRTQVELPDGSSIYYTYDAFFPRSVSRCSKTGEILYTHSYNTYDKKGHLLEETLFGFCGDQKSIYDLDGTKKSIESDFAHDHILEMTQVGEVTRLETRIKEEIYPKNFSYDSLGQLIIEPGQAYTFDGLRNRTSKNHLEYLLNPANQIQSDGETDYAYDPHGHLIQKGEWRFTYDPLGNLIAAEKGDTKISYTYDPFGRRLNRTQYKVTDKRKTKIKTKRLFYISCEEIGQLEDHELLECKILGAFEETLAVEQQGQLFVALRDLQGSIIALVDSNTREVLGSAQWTAFGEEISASGYQASWGYQGKRVDPSTRFIAFGKRDYDPNTGRWTTPDPAGFIDGPNLYQYTWNNPLNFQDRWGLSSGHQDYIYGEVEPHCFCERHRDCKRGGDFDNINPSPYPSAPTYIYQEALWNPSKRFDLSDMSFPELPKGQAGFVNGMATKFSAAIGHALYLSKLAGGYNIYAVYNATHLAPIDFLACAKELYDFVATAPICKLHQNWDSFFSNAGSQELYLQFCHSEGAILVRNALLDYPDHFRKRIIVVAIAPGAYIPKEICARPIHYVSTRDFIPLFDKMGRKICQDTIVHLPPHPDAHFHDHDFQSKTYKGAITEELKEYFKMEKLW